MDFFPFFYAFPLGGALGGFSFQARYDHLKGFFFRLGLFVCDVLLAFSFFDEIIFTFIVFNDYTTVWQHSAKMVIGFVIVCEQAYAVIPRCVIFLVYLPALGRSQKIIKSQAETMLTHLLQARIQFFLIQYLCPAIANTVNFQHLHLAESQHLRFFFI